jgi:apolipoprotein N-acyltransferase
LKLRLALALLAGALLPLAFAPFGFWPLAVLCPALMLGLWRQQSPRIAALLGFGFGVAMFGAGIWWLYVSIHLEASVALAIALVAGVVLYLALYYAALGYLVARLTRGCSPGAYHVAAPLLWLMVEWLRGWLFTGFPWLALGYSQTDTWLAGWAPVIGSLGLSALVLTMSAALLLLWQGSRRQRWLATGAVLLLWIIGRALVPVAWTRVTGAPVSVAILQGAVPQDLKWQASNRGPMRELYRNLNEQALGAQLILWPESAVTELANQIPDYLADIYRRSDARGSTVVMGILRFESTGDLVYNSMLTLGTSLQFYDKRHLVPYSEYFPVPDWIRGWLARMNLPYQDISKGRSDQVAIAAGGLKLAPTICYEDAFGNEQRALLRDADVLANVTNDAWFGRSPARYQHFQMSRMRALEARRFMVRAANDGISAIVGPDGKVVQSATEFTPVVLRGTVTPRRGLTPYARFGDGPLLVAVLLALLWLLWPRSVFLVK